MTKIEPHENGESFYGFKREDLTDRDVEIFVREDYKNRTTKALKKYTIRGISGIVASMALLAGGFTAASFEGHQAREYRTVVQEIHTLERKARGLESLNLEEGVQEISTRIDGLKNSDEYRGYQERSTLPFWLTVSSTILGSLGFLATPLLTFGFGNRYIVRNEREMNEKLWALIPERMQMQKEEQDRRLIKWAEEFFKREFPEKPDDDKPYKQRSYVIRKKN